VVSAAVVTSNGSNIGGGGGPLSLVKLTPMGVGCGEEAVGLFAAGASPAALPL